MSVTMRAVLGTSPEPSLQRRWRPASRHGPAVGENGREIGREPEVIAGPHAVDGLVEQAVARADVERGAVVAAADEDVVDAAPELERVGAGLAGRHHRVARTERVA